MYTQRNSFKYSSGTSLKGHVSIVPALLVQMFGPPLESDGYKVSGEYVFTLTSDPTVVFTIYDYKSTSLYDADCCTPEARWASTVPHDFHIGGSCNASAFIEALTALAVGYSSVEDDFQALLDPAVV